MYQPSSVVPLAASASIAARSASIHASSPWNSGNVRDSSSRAAWLQAVNQAWLFFRSATCVQLASHFWMFVRSAGVSLSTNSLPDIASACATSAASTDNCVARWLGGVAPEVRVIRIERVAENRQENVLDVRRGLLLRVQPLDHRREHARDGDVGFAGGVAAALELRAVRVIADGEGIARRLRVADEAVEDFQEVVVELLGGLRRWRASWLRANADCASDDAIGSDAGATAPAPAENFKNSRRFIAKPPTVAPAASLPAARAVHDNPLQQLRHRRPEVPPHPATRGRDAR